MRSTDHKSSEEAKAIEVFYEVSDLAASGGLQAFSATENRRKLERSISGTTPRRWTDHRSSSSSSVERDSASIIDDSSVEFLSVNDDTGLRDSPSLDTPSAVPIPNYYNDDSFQTYGATAYGHVVHQSIMPSMYNQQPNIQTDNVMSAPHGYGMGWSQVEQPMVSYRHKYGYDPLFVPVDEPPAAEQLYRE